MIQRRVYQKILQNHYEGSLGKEKKPVPLKDIFLMIVGLRKPVQVAEIVDSLTRGHSFLTIICIRFCGRVTLFGLSWTKQPIGCLELNLTVVDKKAKKYKLTFGKVMVLVWTKISVFFSKLETIFLLSNTDKSPTKRKETRFKGLLATPRKFSQRRSKMIENFRRGSLRCIRSNTSAATWPLVCLATKPHILYWTTCLLDQFVKWRQLLPWEVFSESRHWCKIDSNTTHGFRNGLEPAMQQI